MVKIEQYLDFNKSRPNFQKICKRDGYLPEIMKRTSFLDKIFDKVEWGQRLWHVINRCETVVMCEICKLVPAPWCRNRARFRYSCCSDKCSKQKLKNIMMEEYGVENSNQSSIIRERAKKTLKERYGVESALNIPKVRSNTAAIVKKMYTDKMREELPLGYTLISHGTIHEFHHNLCDKNFTLNFSTYSDRKLNSHELCTHCNPLKKSYSVNEKLLVDYIKSIYSGSILENCRSYNWLRLPGGKFNRELDIVLPNLNIAFEYNGTYNHADPRKYKAGDKIRYGTAEDIWNSDKMKFDLCQRNGITLITIWQLDWEDNQAAIKFEILKEINSRR